MYKRQGLRRRFLVGGAGIGPGQPGNQTGADQELSHGADSYSFLRTWQVNSPALVHVKGISFFPETGKRLLFDYPLSLIHIYVLSTIARITTGRQLGES